MKLTESSEMSYLDESFGHFATPKIDSSHVKRINGTRFKRMIEHPEKTNKKDLLILLHTPDLYRPGGIYFMLSDFMDLYQNSIKDVRLMTLDVSMNEVPLSPEHKALLGDSVYPFSGELQWFWRAKDGDRFEAVKMGKYSSEPVADLRQFFAHKSQTANKDQLLDAELGQQLVEDIKVLSTLHNGSNLSGMNEL
eukprot:GHVH01008852.1.p1 GENE.GHVH01008852.1~~GHVH01008852.1.p1  ORF type:complete len:194 (-),score=26.37 GHVH01008852.1:12-593(-)